VSLLTLVLVSRVAAQSAPAERWLFIFDTSTAMKKFLSGTEGEVKNLLASQVSGQLQSGDSIGVWTFGRELRAGLFPLVTWDPAQAATIASNMVAFVHKQNYVGDTSWATLQPQLGQVIKNSARLTVVVFCDGQGTVDWTPYNDGVNQTFSRSLAERKKAHQPFVLLVRTQFGQFVGCTVNFPPGALNVPPFPPLPEPPKPIMTNPPVVVPVVVKPPPVVVPSLFIVGTNAGTNLSDLPKIIAATPPVVPLKFTNVVSVTNRVVAPVSTNPPPPPETNSVEMKRAAPSTYAAASLTNAVTAGSTDDSDRGTRTLINLGAGLFAAAAVVMIFLWARAVRRPRGSLITSSMQVDPLPPPRT
jgi:hypothetical protein